MMRFILGTAFFLIISVGAGWAQTIIVRAGEHAEFTRVVFNVPDRLDVGLTYRENGVDLRFDRGDLLFDIDTVFDVIPRTRLTALDVETGGSGPTVISLSLNCLCDIQTTWEGDVAFVVDIRDETTLSAALFPNPQKDLPLPLVEPAFFPDPPLFAAASAPSDAARAQEERPAQTAQAPDVVHTFNALSNAQQPSIGSVAFLLADAEERLENLRPTPEEPANDYVNRVRDSQGAILQQIGRAATQGLLEPRVDALPEPVDPADTAAPASEPVQTTRDVNQVDQNNLQGNITINAQTSMDQAMSERLNIALEDGQTPGCLDPKRVDAKAWAKEESFVTQIGGLRSNVIGEFDEPSAAAIKKLAQFYIHFGFGLEAKQVMTLLPDGKTPDAVLPAMINILEQGHDGRNSVLAGYMTCDPVVSVWSILSYDKVPGNEPIDPDGIVRGIMAFPVHLRAHLGPVVGEKLRVAGYPSAADHIARVLLRNEDTTSTAATFLDTLSDAAGPDARLSEAGLEEVVADNGQPSAEALLKLIDARLKDNDPMSQEMAVLAGAYATELRDVPMGQDMARAYVLSLAASGAFDEAFSERARLNRAAPAPTEGTLSELVDLLAQKSSDPTFLTHMIGAQSSTRFSLDDSVGNDVGARLLALGFPDQAGAFVAPLAQGEAERTRKLIRAEIALMQDRPRQAEL
ncbi:MAG: hypothetical protein AAF231_06915, partial [Pseudomonadota bacterium]